MSSSIAQLLQVWDLPNHNQKNANAADDDDMMKLETTYYLTAVCIEKNYTCLVREMAQRKTHKVLVHIIVNIRRLAQL